MSLDGLGRLGDSTDRFPERYGAGALAQSRFPPDFFLAVGAGYTFELPAHFLVGIRVEERWAPAQSSVTLPVNEGATLGYRVVTRVWTFTSTGIFGYRFF